MTTRVQSTTVTFVHPFNLDEVDHTLPAGDYVVETEEEQLDCATFLGYRRIGTTIFVRARTGGAVEMWSIHPDSLDRAKAKDRLPAGQ
jgi:hypothetical protein